jgi:hypothetical protein
MLIEKRERLIMNDLLRVIERYMREAIALEENRYENGEINWDFIDADVFMRLNPVGKTAEMYNELFNKVADRIEGVA